MNIFSEYVNLSKTKLDIAKDIKNEKIKLNKPNLISLNQEEEVFFYLKKPKILYIGHKGETIPIMYLLTTLLLNSVALVAPLRLAGVSTAKRVDQASPNLSPIGTSIQLT